MTYVVIAKSKLKLYKTLMAEPHISIILPTLNPFRHQEDFHHMVEAIRGFEIATEIIVIDSGSTHIDLHRTLADHFISIQRAEFGHGKTRNLAAKQARGEFLVFMTQDAVLESTQCLRALVQPLMKDPSMAASFGRQLPRPEATAIEKLSREFNYPPSRQINVWPIDRSPTLKTFFFSNVFSCIRKSVFFEVGGFPEEAILNEDMMIHYKILKKGYRSLYEPSARVIHSHNYPLKDQFKRYFDIGVSIRDQWNQFSDVVQGPEGRQFARQMQKTLWHSRQFTQWIRSFFDLGARMAGFYLGRNHERIPLWLKRNLSLHRVHWV